MLTSRALWLPLLLLATAAAAENGKQGNGSYVIENGRIYTVSGPLIERGAVVIVDGRIADVGSNVKAPAGAHVIDVKGASVYPGLFYADSQLGMKATNERTFAAIRPQLQTYASFHFEDGDAQVIRLSGITQMMVRPIHLEFPGGFSRPGLLPGQASVVSLQGGSPEDMVVARGVGVVLHFPTVGSLDHLEDERYSQFTWSEARAKLGKEMEAIQGFLDEARSYMQRQSALTDAEKARTAANHAYEAMIPVFKRERPLLIDVANHIDIRSAVEFAEAQRVDYVLLGAEEAWRELDFLKEHKSRLIISSPYKISETEDAPIDIMRQLPALLHERGIPFALSSTVLNGISFRLLPYEAGTAVADGLPKDAALRSVTLAPAELLGVADELGSLDKGKRANVVVADGDILEAGTRVTHMFINGVPIDLEIEDAKLFEYYRDRQ